MWISLEVSGFFEQTDASIHPIFLKGDLQYSLIIPNKYELLQLVLLKKRKSQSQTNIIGFLCKLEKSLEIKLQKMEKANTTWKANIMEKPAVSLISHVDHKLTLYEDKV